MSLISDMLQQSVSTIGEVGGLTTIVIAGKPYSGIAIVVQTNDIQDAGDMLMLDASITLKTDDFTYIPKVNDCAVMNGTQYFIKRITDQAGILSLGLSKQP